MKPRAAHAPRAREEPGPFHYVLAGLGVRSAFPLPALEAAGPPPGMPDVLVSQGTLAPPAGAPPARGRPLVEGEEDDLRLYWARVGALAVRKGAEIVVDRAEGVTTAMAAPLVLGVAMGLLLHQRGRLVLHASAVAVGEGAVAFVGAKGAGKSTMAGVLAARGHRLVTDDALPLDASGGGVPMAWPGPAQLKLWPEAAAAIGRPPRRLPRLHPAVSKRVLVDLPASARPLPLRALYALEVGADLAIEPVRGQAAFVEVLRHAYAPRFFPAAGATAAHFERCARVVRAVPVFRLVRAPGLEGLGRVAGAVEAHVAALRSRAGTL